MNREAVALGTPVYTTFEGRLGAVDERLIAERRLRKLAGVEQLDLSKRNRSTGASRTRRDPRELVELLLSPLVPIRP
jgi:predicted glycosyltransferase